MLLTNDQIIGFFQTDADDGSDEAALRIGRAIERAATEAEREACAKMWESQRFMVLGPLKPCSNERIEACKETAKDLARQIRARSTPE
jgi:hypothetical protein